MTAPQCPEILPSQGKSHPPLAPCHSFVLSTSVTSDMKMVSSGVLCLLKGGYGRDRIEKIFKVLLPRPSLSSVISSKPTPNSAWDEAHSPCLSLKCLPETREGLLSLSIWNR